MAQTSITIGGTTHVMGGRARSYRTAVDAWARHDPQRVHDMVGRGTTRREFVGGMIAHSKISGNLKQALRKLHAAICRCYVDAVSRVVLEGDRLARAHLYRELPLSARGREMGFRLVSDGVPGHEDHPDPYSPNSNYTEDMHLLRNMRFAGWRTEDAGDDEFRGFCMLQPLERMRQLMRFPIHRFDDGTLQDRLDQAWGAIDWPDPPTIPDGPAPTDPVAGVHENFGLLEQLEQYYTTVMSGLSRLYTLIDRNPSRG